MISDSAPFSANSKISFEAEYVYRMATPEDAAAICDLQISLGQDEDFLLVTPMDPITGTALLRASLEKMEPGCSSSVIVAELGGKIIGLALCRDHLHPSLSGMVQLTLCVDREHRRRGVGTALLHRSVQWAEANGVRRLQLAVIANNGAALATYRKLDFVIEGTLKKAAIIGGRTHDIHVMARQFM